MGRAHVITKKALAKHGKKTKPNMAKQLFDVIFSLMMTSSGIMCRHVHHGLTVASCCSGWSSDLFALKMLNVPFTSCVGCDTEPSAKLLSTRIHGHHLWVDDCCTPEFLESPGLLIGVCADLVIVRYR